MNIPQYPNSILRIYEGDGAACPSLHCRLGAKYRNIDCYDMERMIIAPHPLKAFDGCGGFSDRVLQRAEVRVKPSRAREERNRLSSATDGRTDGRRNSSTIAAAENGRIITKQGWKDGRMEARDVKALSTAEQKRKKITCLLRVSGCGRCRIT